MIETFRAFTCIICKRRRRRADGRPVHGSVRESWRCADTDDCRAQFLAGAR